MYLIRIALRPWRIAPYSQVFSALAVGFLLFLASLLFWMEQGLKPVIARMRGDQVVTAYLHPSVSHSDSGQLVDTIRTQLGAKAIEVRMVGPQEFVREFKDHYPQLASELEALGEEVNTVIPRYVLISGVLPDKALESIRSLTGIESAESSRDRYRHIIGAFSTLRWIARILGLGLCVALLTGLIHLSRLNSSLHSDSLSLMKHWGASGWTLRVPGLVSGLGVGLLGGAIALLAWLTAGAWVSDHVKVLSPMLREMMIPGEVQIGAALLFVGGALGLASGVWGAGDRVRES